MARIHPLSIAPMMDRTDRHFRFLMRRLTRHTLLYTEMVVADAILNGDQDYLLGFDPSEHPISLQLGGDDPDKLARCAAIAQQRGYDEVNLNVGCPSSRVQAGCFGVSLMGRPDTVAACVAAMQREVDIPVTVKHRIGFDDRDRYQDMLNFVDTVAATGCTRFTVHARKAWLNGLSPKENRNVPPLRYDDVYRLKAERPQLWVELNGGVKTLRDAQAHMPHVDAVMIGRAAYDRPFLFARADALFYDAAETDISRSQIVHEMVPYVDATLPVAGKLSRVVRHMLNLYAGVPGSRAWKRALTEGMARKGAGSEVLLQALEVAEQRHAAA